MLCVCFWLYRYFSEKWGRWKKWKGVLHTCLTAPKPAVPVCDLNGTWHLSQPGHLGHSDVTMRSRPGYWTSQRKMAA